MKWIKRAVYVFCFVALLSVASGCENEGAGEKLGKKFDKAVEKANDHMDKMSDDAKSAYEDMKEAMEK